MVLRGHVKLLALAGILALGGTVGTIPAAGGAESGRFYCCADAAGTTVCGDILPQACYGRAYRELGADGRSVREVAAPLPAEEIARQRAQKAAEEEKRRQETILQKEQQRKDEALLATYVNEDDIEAMRKHALDDVRHAIDNAEKRIAEVKALRKKYEDEAEFYQKKEIPPEIEKGLADTESEIKAQESIIEAKKKEIAVIETKYDEDHKRFLELKRSKIPPQPPTKSP
jgi:DNA repair exonuclease SbcCD ATPase subunit